MGKYPYLNSTGRLREFLEKIPKMSVPEKVTTRALPKLGFGSSSDRQIIPVLKFVNLIDSNGAPNQNYKDFRDSSKAGGIMASELKRAYSELFEIHKNACEQDDKTLRDFFAPTTEGGDQVVNATINTFRVLCGFADFKAVSTEQKEDKGKEDIAKEKGKEEPKPKATAGVNLNVNIQITLPVTDDASVYDKIFKAIKDNLVTRD